MAAERINDWDQLYPGRFLKAGDIREGEKRILTITAVHVDELEGDKGKEHKGILDFEREKSLVLNKTNGVCLREMFGRVPYKWVGRRFAIYQDMWGNDPCIRIWGSPELEADLVVEIKLPKRRPFNMTMHAMGDERSLDRAGKRAGRQLAAVKRDSQRPPPERQGETLGDRCIELMKMMATAATFDDLTDIEADYVTEQFNGRESRALDGAMAKRRKQLQPPEDAPEGTDVDNVIR